MGLGKKKREVGGVGECEGHLWQRQKWGTCTGEPCEAVVIGEGLGLVHVPRGFQEGSGWDKGFLGVFAELS